MGLIDSLMEDRDKKLAPKVAKTGKEQGGMFDFIFRAKKNREQEIQGIQDQDNDPPSPGAVRG